MKIPRLDPRLMTPPRPAKRAPSGRWMRLDGWALGPPHPDGETLRRLLPRGCYRPNLFASIEPCPLCGAEVSRFDVWRIESDDPISVPSLTRIAPSEPLVAELDPCGHTVEAGPDGNLLLVTGLGTSSPAVSWRATMVR